MEREIKMLIGLIYIDRLLKSDKNASLPNVAFNVSRYIGSNIRSRELLNKYEELLINGKLELFNLVKVKDNWALVSKLNPNHVLKLFKDKPDDNELSKTIKSIIRQYVIENIDIINNILVEHEKSAKYNFLNTVVLPKNVNLTESYDNQFIIEQIELYEGFLDSIKTYLQARFDQTMDNVSSTITNFKEAGIVIKDIISNSEYLEKVSTQIGKRLLTLIKTIRAIIAKASNSVNNSNLKLAINKLNDIVGLFTKGQQKAVQLGGWQGLLYKLGMYGFIKFIYSKISKFLNLSELVNFVSDTVFSEFLDKFGIFQNMMNSVSALTMQKFMGFFETLNEVKEIFIDTLSDIRRKLMTGSNISSNLPSVNENTGRIVKGVNTTVDVGPNEISKQAAKFGNKVNKDGYPPILHKKARKNTTPNTLFNLGLTETIKKVGSKYVIYSKDGKKKLGSYTTKTDAEKRLKQIEYFKHKNERYSNLERAIMEGGHTLEEGPLDKLKKLGKAAAVATSLGTTGFLGAIGYDGMTQAQAADAQRGQSSQSSARSATQRAQDASTSTSNSELAPKKSPIPKANPRNNDKEDLSSVKPKPRPDVLLLTQSPYEKLLLNYAKQSGMQGIELVSFMSQMAVESQHFQKMIERGTKEYFDRYEPDTSPERANTLGNTVVGDGFRYRGRGYVQLTGKYNYNLASEALNIDLINNPELAANPHNAAKIALWYWNSKVKRLTDDFDDVKKVTYLINGGYHALKDRREYFNRYKNRLAMTEAEIVDLDTQRKEKELKDFHKKIRSDISSRMEEKTEAYRIAKDQGIFDDLPVGSRFTLEKGASYKVISHSMNMKKTDQLPRYQLEFRNKFKFGPPKFIEYNGKYYQPIVYATEVAGENEGSKSGFELDKLINFETGEKRYKKFTGPKRVTEKRKQNQVKGKEKLPKMSKPSTSGEQPHPYRGRLVGETIIDLTPFLISEYEKSIKNKVLSENKIDNERVFKFLKEYTDNSPSIKKEYIYCNVVIHNFIKMLNFGYTKNLYNLVDYYDNYYIFDMNKNFVRLPHYKDMGDSKLFSFVFSKEKDFKDFFADLMLQFSDEYKIEKNVIDKNVIKEEWYHGTPDVRDLQKIGGFENRTMNVSYISNPSLWRELQTKANELRDTDNTEYFKVLDEITKLRKYMTVKSPVFLTNVYNVAKTYADDTRAFDYQGANPRILKVEVDAGKNLKINADGKDFRGIDLDVVIKSFINGGVSIEKIKNVIEMFSPELRNNKLSTDAVSVIAQLFNFDTVDVTGVLDSFNVGKIKSTVRMVFDPKRIKIISNLKESFGYKVMAYDRKNKIAYSLADKNVKFPIDINKKITIGKNGLYLSNNKDFVKNYYSGLTDTDEILVKFEYDPVDIISGNDSDSESEFTVKTAKIADIELLSETISVDLINFLKENMSVTGTATAVSARKKGLEPGTPEWFEHWFSLPYMIDQRKKNKGRKGKRK